jgi:transcription antitermination factor NusG
VTDVTRNGDVWHCLHNRTRSSLGPSEEPECCTDPEQYGKERNSMNEFAIGDTVQITGPTMTGNVGTVVSIDEKRGKFLVRITDVTQNYFTPTDLKLFSA